MSQVPQSFTTLEERITAEYPTLSRRLQQTARFLLDHPQEVAFATVAQLAQQAGVTPSTLIRFSNNFGFSGFSEMQQLFRARLFDELPNYNERIRAVRTATGETPDSTQLLWEFASANQEVLQQLPDRINPDHLENALDIFEKAQAIHVMGARRSFVVASYMTYALHHIEKPAFLMNGIGGMYSEQVKAVATHDALLVISFAPYAQESRDVAEEALRRGIPLVVLTDSSLSPLVRLSDVALIVHEAEVKSFRGLTASLCLTQTLAISLGVRQDKALDLQKAAINLTSLNRCCYRYRPLPFLPLEECLLSQMQQAYQSSKPPFLGFCTTVTQRKYLAFLEINRSPGERNKYSIYTKVWN